VTEQKISVTGLADFNRSLRRLDSEAPKGLRLALNAAAGTLIDATRPEIPRRTGAAAKSLVVRSTRTSARVGVGGKRAPYYPWLDFGGRTGRKRSVKRPFIREGRYLYPTLGRIKPKIMAQLADELDALAKSAGLDVD
jgi:hypothetical protein